MKYEIVGENFPAVRCHLVQGESMKCEGGSMAWMDDEITMKTEGGGGIGKAFGRMFSGESIFFNHYTCEGSEGEVVFSSSYPGKIVPIELHAGQSIIAQKHAFLAAT
ncbi:MAG: AIM24 family protein, partial [Mogibacterium sp.]|nr:AIM24 family protein [Mogibacterium sp.]